MPMFLNQPGVMAEIIQGVKEAFFDYPMKKSLGPALRRAVKKATQLAQMPTPVLVVGVGTDETDQTGCYGDGRIHIWENNCLKSYGDLLETVAHELKHFEQDVLMVLNTVRQTGQDLQAIRASRKLRRSVLRKYQEKAGSMGAEFLRKVLNCPAAGEQLSNEQIELAVRLDESMAKRCDSEYRDEERFLRVLKMYINRAEQDGSFLTVFWQSVNERMLNRLFLDKPDKLKRAKTLKCADRVRILLAAMRRAVDRIEQNAPQRHQCYLEEFHEEEARRFAEVVLDFAREQGEDLSYTINNVMQRILLDALYGRES